MREALLAAALGLWANQVIAQPASPPPTTRPAASKPAAKPAEAPAAPATPVGAVRSFDSAKVSLAWNNRRWQLVHAGEVLKDFGSHEREARQALRLIQELKLDGYAAIGGPRPVMEYWLAGGEAPRGVIRGGLRSAPLEPSRIRVEQVQGQWCLRDAPQVLFNFGPGAADAREALAVLQRYHFDQIGVIGQASPSMYVFLRKPHDGAPSLPEHLRAAANGRHMAGPHFDRLAKNKDGTPRFEKKAATGAGLEQVVQPAHPALAPAKGASDWHGQSHFGHRKLQAPAPVSDRAQFDWRQARLRQVNGEWCLQAGAQTLARFGANLREGQMALSALRHYRFGEHRRIGDPSLTLYLPTAQSPQGVLLGLQAERFEPEKVSVENVEGRFALVEGKRVVLSLGQRKEDADKVLEMVKHERFDRMCQLGDPYKDGMTFFTRSRPR